MAYKSALEVPSSGNPWIDGLTDGYRWGTTTQDSVIGFTFVTDTRGRPSGQFGGYPSWGWSHLERAQMHEAMDAISSVCRLEFYDRGDDNDDNVELWFYSMDRRSAENNYGFAYTPGSDPDEGLVAINWSTYRRPDGTFKASIESGSFYGITFLHELSHAVGLKHPHDLGLMGQPRFPGLTPRSDEFRDQGEFGQNAHPFTQLSYVDKGADHGLVPDSELDYGFLQTPGALDIAALQWMYGVNGQQSLGDDVYRLPLTNDLGTGWISVWDAGGNDRITAIGASIPVTIDLRNASLGQDSAAGGYISRAQDVLGGFTIAHDWDGFNLTRPAGLCVIEMAIGGNASDRLIGNAAANRLKGKKGDDVLFAGSGGGNVVTGGKGKDFFWINGEAGSFVDVTDFNPRKDRLVFDLDPASVSFVTTTQETQLLVDGIAVAHLQDVTRFSLSRHVLFQEFTGL